MNVVRREKEKGIHSFRGREHKFKNRNDSGFGIMGPLNYNPKGLPPNNTNMPRYNLHTATQNCMGPPAAIPRQNKRKLPTSNPNDFETSTSNSSRRKILAEDISADSSFFTPKNRPLKYISSSSKGKSQSHSARSTTTTSNSVAESCVILAISEGRGLARGEVGIAAIDLKHPQIVLCQLSDSLLYTDTLTKINFFRPVEIIIPHTFCEGQPTALFKVLSRTYPNIPLQKVQRRHFNDAIGLQQIKNLCAPQYSGVSLLILHKFYALTAAAAVLKYVEYIQCIVFANHSLKVDYHCSDNSMLIDINTAERLELVQPLDKSAGMSCSLLGVLGPTLTCPGARLLRASILQPSCSREEIEARLDSVQELIEDSSGLFATLQNTVKKLADVDKILFLCIDSSQQDVNKMCEAQLNQTLTLKTTMELVPSIIEALASANSGKFRKIKMDLEHTDYVAIRDRIKDIIREDAHMEKGTIGTLQRCFAIKPDINGLLDVARRTYSELIDEIQKLVEHLSETHDLQLKLTQSSTKGFHIVLPIAPKNRRNFAVEELPDVFIKVQNNGTNVSMTTEELIILDQQARESLNEIQNMSNIVIHGLLRELRPYMGSLYKLCEHVGELDLLMALAEASIAGSYIRPEFDDYTSIRNCVHPLLEYNSQMYPVTNDVFSSPEHNFTIVTGPNMGGKSIYIKQVALLQIMAQVGCFLPCSDAVLRISDHIFSRIGFNDSIELGASTYVLEMKEMQYILKNVTPTSLIIIDELCRGTSSEEGASVAWAICEKLAQTSAFTFFTTHFLYLTKLQDLYSNVVNLCTSVSEELNPSTNVKSLKYHHKIEKGVTCIDHYGLGLARKTNINPATLDLATELADFLSSHRKSNVETPQARSSFSYLYDLNSSVKMEKRKSSEPERAISNVFNAFKSKHRGILLELKNQLLIDTSESESLNQKDTTARSIHSNGLEKGDYDPDPESTVGSTPLFSKTHGISSDGGPVLGKETSKVNDQQNNRVECESNVKENQSATTPAAKNISQSSDMITYPHSTLPPRTIFSSEEVSSSNRSSERFLTPNRRGYCSTPNTDDNRERNNLTTERPLIVQYSSDESESQNPSPRFGGYSLEMSFSPRPQPSYEYGNRRNVCINPPVFIPESDEKSNSSETRYNILETILDAQCSSKHIDTRETMPNVANDNFESDDEIMGDVLDSLNSSQLSTQILARELTSPSNDSTMCYEDLYKETVNEIMEDFNLENDTDDLQLYLTPPMEFRD